MLGKILKILGSDKPSTQAMPATSPVTRSAEADLHIADGNRAEEAGDLLRACEHYRKAVAIAPQYAAAHLNLGIGLEAIGNLEQACQSYESALGIDPADVYANYNLGRQLFSRNAIAEAEPLLRRAIDGNADFVDARVVLSRLLENKGELEGAAAELEQALRVRPDYFGALCNYADLLMKLGRADDAVSAWRRAIEVQPRNFDVNYKLAYLLSERGESAEAERLARQALRSNPTSLDARALMVNLYLSQGNLSNAAVEAEAALKLRPDWLDLLFDYGLILKRLARQAEAEAVFRRAIALDQTYVRAYQMLGAVLISQARIQDALDVFSEGRKHCDDAFDLESPEMFALNCKEDISIDDLFARHADYGRRLEQHHPARFEPFDNARDPGRRLRIGYISGDLQHHVVPLFLLPLLEERDRAAFEVYCYSTGDTADKVTEQLRGLADVWRDVARKPANDVADMIHRDRIDILVDLAGHSGTPNLRVFAQRPAPVQATWVGYLNTTGLTRIQYRISDDHCDPPGLTDRYHTEKLIRLPHSQWCYRPFVEVACESQAPFESNGHVTFGSFNQTVKITPGVRKLWGEILTQVPDSRLLVVGVVDNRAREDLLRDLENAGVDRSRVTMLSYVPFEEYYRSFGRVDIALDTMPFSGGTTTCDALWMGTPVITAPGVRSWSRSAASILATLGMQDWIAESPEDYVRRAVQFARNPSTIAQLRKSLRSRMLGSPLMDKGGFARDMEQVYRRMWQSWCSQTGG
jgi:predicted O-linked N-acetylglucosamine transferase (SPINDLY family)